MKDPKTQPNSRAIFLDRDGVINVDHGYVHKSSDLEFCPQVKEALQVLSQRGFLLLVITNQAGVARGYYTENDVHIFHKAISEELATLGVEIDKFYHCPHHPEGTIEGYSTSCDCRKPATGMVETALVDFPQIDLESSYLVGDKISDIDCGKAMGLKTVQITSEKYPHHDSADIYASQLWEAIPHLL